MPHPTVNMTMLHYYPEPVKELIEYIMGCSRFWAEELENWDGITIEGLQERASLIPPNVLREAFNKHYLLHHVLVNGKSVTLELVEYILSLAPEAASFVDNGDGVSLAAHFYGTGSYPLHIACFDANCPVSVIALLLDKYPAAIEHAWGGRGLPLHCYLERAKEHEEDGYEDSDGFYQVTTPSFPTGELDYDTVQALVEAHPKALVGVSSAGTPMHILCQGFGVTLELALLLTDKERACFELSPPEDSIYYYGPKQRFAERVPIMYLLRNDCVSPFPTDALCYLLECNPFPIEMWIVMWQKLRGDKEVGSFDFGAFKTNRTPLHMACSNPNITAEAVQLILNACPDMAKEQCKSDGFLPIHALCKNPNLDETASLIILKLLVQAYPESVGVKVNRAHFVSYKKPSECLPIHLACVHKSFDFCEFLLDLNPASASEKVVYCTDEYTDRGSRVLPFHLACRYESMELVESLLEKYPQAIHEQTEDENYNCDEAVGDHYERIEVDDSNSLLLEKGNFPVHLAASRKDCPAKTKILAFLLQQVQGVASKVGKYGNLALHKACGSNLHGIGNLVRSNYSAVHTKNIFGQFPIHLAMKFAGEDDFDDLVYLAKQLPFALGELDSRGMSCAHYACTSEAPLMKLKIIAEIHPDAFRTESYDYVLPIHFACTEGSDLDAVQYLARQFPEALDEHLDYFGLPLHCSTENEKAFDFLLSERYKTSIERGTPRFHALLLDERILDKDPIIESLLYKDMDIEDQFGRLPAHLLFGATSNDELLGRFPFYKQDLPSKQDYKGWLPLHYAMWHNVPEYIATHIMQGRVEYARVPDNEGATPLHIACRHGCPPTTIMALVGDGGDLSGMVDNNGQTLLMRHVEERHRLKLSATWKV